VASSSTGIGYNWEIIVKKRFSGSRDGVVKIYNSGRLSSQKPRKFHGTLSGPANERSMIPGFPIIFD
jgi:hypothetical protein